ncbi:hypothetical protein AQBE111736_14060 [Aquirufa beregesia]
MHSHKSIYNSSFTISCLSATSLKLRSNLSLGLTIQCRIENVELLIETTVGQHERNVMNAVVDEVLTLAWEMCVGVKNIVDSGVNHGSAKRNSPLLDDKKRSFFVSFFSKKENPNN